jgi:hypothetical protein
MLKYKKIQTNKIDLSQLGQDEIKELTLFYQFLLYKSNKINNFIIKNNLPETFYKPIVIDNYQKFNRDEIYTKQ